MVFAENSNEVGVFLVLETFREHPITCENEVGIRSTGNVEAVCAISNVAV